jgi:opacity protein-like surface antigen
MAVMVRVGLLMIGAALLALPGTAARAADMPDYPALPVPLPPREDLTPRIQELVSGWYLRGDVGYRFQQVSGASDTFGDYSNTSIHDSAVLGLGAGWKSGWFRADLTGDYAWRSEFSGTAANGAAVTANIDSFTVMGNAYIDFGTWYGMTPYVGGGIGGAYVTMANYESSPPAAQMPPNYSRWNLAWSAMAGVSFAVGYNSVIDISYRHIEMGDVIGGPSGNELTVDNLRGDEIRIGFRYLLN